MLFLFPNFTFIISEASGTRSWKTECTSGQKVLQTARISHFPRMNAPFQWSASLKSLMRSSLGEGRENRTDLSFCEVRMRRQRARARILRVARAGKKRVMHAVTVRWQITLPQSSCAYEVNPQNPHPHWGEWITVG